MGATGTVGALGSDGVAEISREAQIVVVLPGLVTGEVDFANWIPPLGQIHGFKWNDLDADGVWDQPDEPALAGWTIFLDTNANGLLNPGEVSTVTAADGSYSFVDLPAGPYVVAEVLQAGWLRSFTPKFVPLDPGEVATNVNFGNRLAPGSIEGLKWNDLDGDGERDENEPGLADWTIFIDADSDGMLDEEERSTTTNSNGIYQFSQLMPGNYVLAEVQQPGWGATLTPPMVTVLPGQTTSNVDFGNRALPGSIHGQKWNDLDGDGVKDEGEPGMAGWTIFLDTNQNGTLDEGELSTTTGANGTYEFTGLSVGNYRVAEVQSIGWQQTLPASAVTDQLLAELAGNNGAITALVPPNRYDFSEGEVGNEISDGGDDMYDGGNVLATNLSNGISYTNGVATAADAYFGAGSRYFTAKYPGLFVLGAEDISIASFAISGGTGADGAGNIDGNVLSTTVNGHPYTIFLKRTFNAGKPSINQIVIVPGSGAGISHSFPLNTDDDFHEVIGLASVDQLYYLLVSRVAGGFLTDADILNIANEFLSNVGPGTPIPHVVTIGPGQNVPNIDFGNRAVAPQLVGDYNYNGTVDAADYVVWRKSLGMAATPSTFADGDASGVVDQADYGVWRAHFGQSLSASGSTAAINASEDVSQPATAPIESGQAAPVTFDPETAVVNNEVLESTIGSGAASAPVLDSPTTLVIPSVTIARTRQFRPPAAATRNSADSRDEALMAWLSARIVPTNDRDQHTSDDVCHDDPLADAESPLGDDSLEAAFETLAL